MWELCLGQFAEITTGHLRFGSLPPLAGDLEPVRRIVTDSLSIGPGDVFVILDLDPYRNSLRANEAFDRGAFGVLMTPGKIEPWAGRFILDVCDPRAALLRLVARCPHAARRTTFVIHDKYSMSRSAEQLVLEELTDNHPRIETPI